MKVWEIVAFVPQGLWWNGQTSNPLQIPVTANPSVSHLILVAAVADSEGSAGDGGGTGCFDMKLASVTPLQTAANVLPHINLLLCHSEQEGDNSSPYYVPYSVPGNQEDQGIWTACEEHSKGWEYFSVVQRW